ncbi:MAG: leucine-rich repeat domain-containing protein [Oscillospiraceae bacterium]|nr:leucine-rich repeat domain-containing protein [Oscillospiraceae bacterium]
MKKIIAFCLAVVMILSLAACGGTSVQQSTNTPETSTPPSSTPDREYDESDPTAVLNEISTDFATVTENLSKELTDTFSAVGTTYEDYQKNKGLVNEWVALVLSESDALFSRTRENSIAYFKLIAADPDHKYSEFCDEALDEYYDTVYDKAMDEYYDTLYDDAMDDLYDEYYDGILDNAYDDVEYSEWSDASSECYKVWSDASSAVYKKWSDESSYIYGLWSAMSSAFCYNDNYDVDAIVTEYEQEKATEDVEKEDKESKEYTEFDVLYEINADGDAEVVGFSGEGNQITISSSYEGSDVVRIADAAFENCTMLESIIMWADIEEIGNSAFKGCTGLTEFSVPSDTTMIGHNAFDGCSNLETLIIWGDPDIGEYAFANCASLTEISIGSDTKNVGAHAFEGCTSVTSLIIWGVEIIGDYAFAGCTGIEDISIPSDVLSIGNHAFDGCSALTSVIVWDDDTAIGKDAFANCPNLSDAPKTRGTVLECTFSKNETSSDNKPTDSIEGTTTTDGIRPEFKEAMDAYESFYTEYCEFMQEYSEKPTDLTLLAKYSDMLVKAEEMNEAFEEWDEDELNSEELKYYLDVNNRVMKMLVDVAG